VESRVAACEGAWRGWHCVPTLHVYTEVWSAPNRNSVMLCIVLLSGHRQWLTGNPIFMLEDTDGSTVPTFCKRRGGVVSTLASYLRGPGFNSRIIRRYFVTWVWQFSGNCVWSRRLKCSSDVAENGTQNPIEHDKENWTYVCWKPAETVVAREWLCSRHIMPQKTRTDRSVLCGACRGYITRTNCHYESLGRESAGRQLQKLVAQAGDRLGTYRKGNVRHSKPL
jgi:hypothetical protein